jgi:hypothetical protein
MSEVSTLSGGLAGKLIAKVKLVATTLDRKLACATIAPLATPHTASSRLRRSTAIGAGLAVGDPKLAHNYVPASHKDVPLVGLDPSSALPVSLMIPIRHGLFGRVS